MERENLTFQKRDDTLIACLCCEIDHHTARHLRQRLDSELFLHRPRTLIMDFSGVKFMDSSGIGVIMGRYKQMSYVGGTVCVCGIEKNVDRIFQMSGLYKLVTNLDATKGA